MPKGKHFSKGVLMKKTWKELLPDALLGETVKTLCSVTLNGEVIYLLESTLTERERFLIETLNTATNKTSIPTHPWLACLEGKGALPTPQRISNAYTWRYFQSKGVFQRKDLVGVRRELNGLDPCRLQNFRHHYTLVVNPEVAPSLASTLFEVQSAIE